MPVKNVELIKSQGLDEIFESSHWDEVARSVDEETAESESGKVGNVGCINSRVVRDWMNQLRERFFKGLFYVPVSTKLPQRTFCNSCVMLFLMIASVYVY